MTKQPFFSARSWRPALAAALLVGLLSSGLAHAAAGPGGRQRLTEEQKQEFQANDMIRKGMDYLEQNLEEQGIKLIRDVPRMYPKTEARFKAYLELGKYLVDKRRFEEAIKNLREVNASEDADQRAEAIYQIGISYYGLNQFSQAFASLQKVIDEYPWSVYANEAYYYIGLCHFKLERWAKAIDALRMVGTSVPPKEKLAEAADGKYRAEAGQRFYIRVFDKDLIVLPQLGEDLPVDLATKNGDSERIILEKLDRQGEYYIGSLPSGPGKPKTGDGILQVASGDIVNVTYTDRNTAEGERDRKLLAQAQLVSTASGGFTDGAFKEYVQGIYLDDDCFIRVRDLDRDISDDRDRLTITLTTEYDPDEERRQAEGEDAAPAITRGVDLDAAPDYEQRDRIEIELEETGPHTGVFTGVTTVKPITEGVEVSSGDTVLHARLSDRLKLEYIDELHMLDYEPRRVEVTSALVTGSRTDVQVTNNIADNLDHEARKNLIESKLYLELGRIFKDVGLDQKAGEKAQEGIDRVDRIIANYLKDLPLDRTLVEEAFSVKWELLLVQDRLSEAIRVCHTLTQVFPKTSLVDKALFTIGKAKMEEDGRDSGREAIGIFTSILRLPESDYKAEAQYLIGQIHEKAAMARMAQTGQRDRQALGQALTAYQKCADTYPDSPMAGEALDKIANFYIEDKQYRRAVELFERIFLEHPHAEWLDKMLLKWGIAAYRMKNFQMAREKFDQIVVEYPSSPEAAKARKFLQVVERKLGG